MFGSSLPPVVCRMANVLFTCNLPLFAHSGAQHIVLCFCFVFVFLYCQFLWIVHFRLPFRYSLTFIPKPLGCVKSIFINITPHALRFPKFVSIDIIHYHWDFLSLQDINGNTRGRPPSEEIYLISSANAHNDCYRQVACKLSSKIGSKGIRYHGSTRFIIY